MAKFLLLVLCGTASAMFFKGDRFFNDRNAKFDKDELLKALFPKYDDIYDFVLAFNHKQERFSNSYLSTIMQDISGISKSLYKIPYNQGAGSRMRAVAALTEEIQWTSRIREKETGNTVKPIHVRGALHELEHYWMASLKGVFPEGHSQSLNSHWVRNLDLFYGDERYIDPLAYTHWIVEKGSTSGGICVDTSKPDGPVQKFSDISLYAMGLLPPGDVKPIIVQEFERTDSSHYNYWGPNCRQTPTWTGQREVSIDQIIEANGPRVPAFAQSQKNFRCAAMIVVPDGADPDAGFVEFVKDYSDELEKAWTRATGGRSTLTIDLVGEDGSAWEPGDDDDGDDDDAPGNRPADWGWCASDGDWCYCKGTARYGGIGIEKKWTEKDNSGNGPWLKCEHVAFNSPPGGRCECDGASAMRMMADNEFCPSDDGFAAAPRGYSASKDMANGSKAVRACNEDGTWASVVISGASSMNLSPVVVGLLAGLPLLPF